jgi:hypothetical protein
VNGIAHLIFFPLSFYLGIDGWWLLLTFLLSQSFFGITYGVHFLIEWARGGFNQNWVPAYKRIWAEAMAYQLEKDILTGKKTDVWGI